MATPTFPKINFSQIKNKSRRLSGDAREKCRSTIMLFSWLFNNFWHFLNNLIYWDILCNLWNFNDWLFNSCLNLRSVMNDNQSFALGGRLIFLKDYALGLITPIEWFRNLSVVGWIVEYVPFRSFNISNEKFTNGP